MIFADEYVQLINSAEFRANGNAVFLDADNDTGWQAGTDDVAQLTIGGAGIMISVSGASTVIANTLIMGDDIDLNSNSLINGSIDTSLIDSGILGIARGGTSNATNARGDILYSPTTATWSRLPIGSVGQV